MHQKSQHLYILFVSLKSQIIWSQPAAQILAHAKSRLTYKKNEAMQEEENINIAHFK